MVHKRHIKFHCICILETVSNETKHIYNIFPSVKFITIVFHILCHVFSIQEMKKLAEDEDRILELLRDLPQLEKIAKDRQELFNGNEQLAKDNVAKKPVLEESKRILLEKVSASNVLINMFTWGNNVDSRGSI